MAELDNNSILSLLISAVLGALFGMMLPAAKKAMLRHIRRRAINQRKDLLNSGKVRDWLIDYYRKKESHVDLFCCQLGKSDVMIPLLTRPSWQIPEKLNIDCDKVLNVSRNIDSAFPIKNRLLKRRAYLGQKLFGEGNTMYLDRIEDQDKLQISVKHCHFRQMASRLIELEEETFAAVRSRFKKQTPLRDRCLPDVATAAKVNERPFSVGCTVAFVIRHSGNYKLLIHKRSTKTMTYGGSRAVIPNFGLEPNWASSGSSRMGLIFYNFIKEYCEELFDYEELTDISIVKRPSVDWFTCLPEADSLLKMYEAGSFSLDFLGFGIDALNGTGNIALLALVKDDSIASTLVDTIRANWEVARGKKNLNPIEFIAFNDPKLEKWLCNGNLQYGSAFTIHLAINRLKSENINN
jgi:hypothetical protein